MCVWELWGGGGGGVRGQVNSMHVRTHLVHVHDI